MKYSRSRTKKTMDMPSLIVCCALMIMSAGSAAGFGGRSNVTRISGSGDSRGLFISNGVASSFSVMPLTERVGELEADHNKPSFQTDLETLTEKVRNLEEHPDMTAIEKAYEVLKQHHYEDWKITVINSGGALCMINLKEIWIDQHSQDDIFLLLHEIAHIKCPEHDRNWADRFTCLCQRHLGYIKSWESYDTPPAYTENHYNINIPKAEGTF